MGKAQKKTGKNRLDKYYKLAKEQGYRARSAFKLIQLNKKYSFLEHAKCCIDLCAAPGGWLQVATKYMPANSVIVGVDLVPIKPIPRVSTIAADITTPQCRNLIRAELKDWKADVVLHDGAPNVGTAWVQDAYGQSELVLMSLKLAVEFLAKSGTFVTKVFRSTDYNNLMWVFNQLFERVEATKPPSSRNVSAEIFVICRGYLAPKHVDPKFLDPKHVFKDFTVPPSGIDKGTSAPNAQANVYQPEKHRRKREGYDDGDYTLFKAVSAAEFVAGKDAVGILGTVNKVTFESEEEKRWLSLDITSLEVKAICEDLKVLGKGDFKTLLKWRSAMRKELGIDVKTHPVEELTETAEVVDEEQEIETEIQRINAEAAARAKRERRRANEIKARTIQRMQLRMVAPMDIGMEFEDKGLEMGQEDIYDLGAEETSKRRAKPSDVMALMDAEDEEDDKDEEDGDGYETLSEGEQRERDVLRLEQELDGLYDEYRSRKIERDAKYKVKEERKKNKERNVEWTGFEAADSDAESEAGGWERAAEAKAKVGEDSSDDDGTDEEARPSLSGQKRRRDELTDSAQRKKLKLITTLDDPEDKSNSNARKAAQVWFAQDIFKDVEDIENISDAAQEMVADGPSDENHGWEDMSIGQEIAGEELGDDHFEVVPREQDDAEMWDIADENQDEAKEANIQKFGLVTPEAVTLAQQLVNREKTKTELINDGFNRYSFNSRDGLPSWFLDDESKHYKSNIPITKEAVAALRAKQRALDARPIKKIAEAKARKKHRAIQRFEKAMKKAEGVNENTDISEREKARQIEKLMKRGSKGKANKSKAKVVVAKGAHKGLRGRPKGVKGRYVMVDARMKKELRSQARKDKAKKKRR